PAAVLALRGFGELCVLSGKSEGSGRAGLDLSQRRTWQRRVEEGPRVLRQIPDRPRSGRWQGDRIDTVRFRGRLSDPERPYGVPTSLARPGCEEGNRRAAPPVWPALRLRICHPFERGDGGARGLWQPIDGATAVKRGCSISACSVQPRASSAHSS